MLFNKGCSPTEKYDDISSWQRLLEIIIGNRDYPLFIPLSPGAVRAVRLMLEYGADPNQGTMFKFKPPEIPAVIALIRVMEAYKLSLDEYKDIFNYLLEYGVELEPKWPQGTTVLEEAERKDPTIRTFILRKVAEYRISRSQRSLAPEETQIAVRQKT